MTKQATNVASIQKPAGGQDPIEAAMDAAIAELDEKDCNGNVAADLIEAREQYREQRRQQAAAKRSGETGERLDVLARADQDLAGFLRGSTPAEPTRPLEDARTVADLLSCVGSAQVGGEGGQAIEPELASRVGWLLVRELDLARGLMEHEGTSASEA